MGKILQKETTTKTWRRSFTQNNWGQKIGLQNVKKSERRSNHGIL
jgi:hypothetical protein